MGIGSFEPGEGGQGEGGAGGEKAALTKYPANLLGEGTSVVMFPAQESHSEMESRRRRRIGTALD